jgi:hypothetical protein
MCYYRYNYFLLVSNTFAAGKIEILSGFLTCKKLLKERSKIEYSELNNPLKAETSYHELQE